MDLKKILLVEDETLIALAETASLKRQGYEVVTARNGLDAIGMVEKDPSLDLVLMDIDLGEGMDGTEAAQCILKKRDIPILFLSNHSEAEIVDRTYQIGAYGYVLKSGGETVLLASLRMAFKLHEAHLRQLETERALKSIQTYYDSVIRKAPLAVYILQEGKCVFANEKGASLLGYTSPEEVRGISTKEVMDPTTPPHGESFKPSRRLRVRRRDGQSIWMESISVPLEYQNRPAALMIGIDVSETVEAEEKLRKESFLCSFQSELLEYSFSHDVSQTLRKVIDLACALTESPIGFFHLLTPLEEGTESVVLHAWSTDTIEKYCTAKGLSEHYPLEQAGIWADCARLMQPVIHNDYAMVEDRTGFPEGHPFLIRELTVPVIRENRCVAILGVGNKATFYHEEDLDIASRFSDLAWDIVERKARELSLQQSEREQRYLFKELGHRTKNTFHQILSLASLQANQETEGRAKEVLLDLRARISVLAGLYETLQGEESATVSLKELVQHICSSLSEAFAFRSKQTLTHETESITMDSRSASAFGLILNELITNSYKHAFPENRRGTIQVSLIRKENSAVLTVEDDGVGFNPSIREGTQGRFGLELVDTLVDQLGATLEITSTKGARAVVTIPLQG